MNRIRPPRIQEMRILHCILSMHGGGAERQLRDLAPALASRGHDVHVAVVFPGVHSAGLTPKCTVHEIGARGSRDPRIVSRVFNCIRRLRPDLVQTWLTHMDIVAGGSATLLRIPWVLSERSAALSYPPTLLNRLRVLAGRRASLVIANSPGGADYWRSCGVNRIDVIPNFVTPSELHTDEVVDDPRIAADDEVILSIGRLNPEKNPVTVVQAFRTVQAIHPKSKLVFCGEGPLRAAIEAEAAAAGLRDRVVFAGFVNVAAWLKRASAVVSVSSCEGHPNAVLEAMVARVPLVLSDIPSHRNVAGDSAWFVPVEDAEAIGRELAAVLSNPAEAARRAERGRESVESLSLETVALRYEEAYRNLLAGRAVDRRMLIPKGFISR